MSFDIAKIIGEMGLFALIVFVGLAVMAVAAIAVFGERMWVFWRTRKKSLSFAAVATKALESNDYDALEKAAAAEKSNHLASLLHAGMKSYLRASKKPSSDVGPVELARREVERQSDVIAAKLRRGLGVLASVGSTAPFVGLLGTVVGIIAAFQGIAAEGSGGLGAVSAGIAEALVVTAFGLLVAIPAVLIFNFLSTKADSLELAIDQARGEFIDHIETHHSATLAQLGGESLGAVAANEEAASAA